MANAELKGNIQFMSLGTLLSLNCNEQRTARFEIENEAVLAEIFIENGNIVHAAIDSEIGEAAFYRIFALKEGIFSTYPNETAPRHTIEKNWSKLLLDAARQLDEDSATQEQEVDWSNFKLSDFNSEQAEKIIDERLQRMVKALRRLKGILGVIVVSRDSKLLEYDTEYDPLDFIQRANALLETGQKLGSLIGAGYLKHALRKNHQNTILINRGQDAIFISADKDVISDLLIDEIYLIMKRYR